MEHRTSGHQRIGFQGRLWDRPSAPHRTIDSGVVTFSINDSFGNAGTVASPQITINNGGTLASGGKFNTMWNLAINGGTLLANGGVNNPFGAFGLKGTVTIGGTSVSTIAVGGVNGFETISLGHGANSFTTFNVADVTSSTAADLIVNAGLNANSGSANIGLIKTGAGTMRLTATNTYSGATQVREGTLEINGGTIPGPGLIDIGSVGVTQADFNLVSGSVTAGSQFVVGAHGSNSTATHTAGSLQVNGTIYLGGYGEGTGTGTYTQNGGTVTSTGGINFGGGGPNSGVYNLNGGTLTTTTIVKNGGGTANFNFNGGTLTASANSTTFLQGLTAATVQAGGGTINSNGFNITISQTLLDGGGGMTKSGAGILTLTSNASTVHWQPACERRFHSGHWHIQCRHTHCDYLGKHDHTARPDHHARVGNKSYVWSE